jgi:Zn-dependent protease
VTDIDKPPLPRRTSNQRRITHQGHDAIRLFRVGETVVLIHPSFALVIIAAIAFGVAHYGTAFGVAFNILSVLMIYGCVLLHELAHALYAERAGLLVLDITLLPIGGVANMEATLIPPRAEVEIALAGPLANLALGACFITAILVAAAAQPLGLSRFLLDSVRDPSVVGLLMYQAAANLVLGLFNLIPAFPLDGGRALRAVLARRMSFERATSRAAIVGRACGTGMMATAAGLLLLSLLPYALALGVVGYVLYREASREWCSVLSQSALLRWSAGEVARKVDLTVQPHQPLALVVNAVLSGQVVPVVVVAGDRHKLVGLVTSADLRQRNGKLGDLSVAHIMRTKFPSVRTSGPLWIAHEKLRTWKLTAIPVMADEQLEGLVTLAEIQRVLRHDRSDTLAITSPSTPPPLSHEPQPYRKPPTSYN